MSQRFDAIVIGTGQAGPPLVGRLAAAGMSVAIIERKLFGGTCVNTGCMPTKTLVASAYAAHIARRGSEYGFAFDGELRIDMARVQARATAVSARSRKNVEAWLRGIEHCTVFTGHARFVGPDAVSVGDATLTAPRIFINVGGRASVPDLPGIADVPFLTNSTLLERKRVPKHLVVVGGSYVGLEFAQCFRRFGAEVTVVEMGECLIGGEDEDVSAAVRTIIEAEGIAVRTGAQCISLGPHNEGVAVSVECTEGDPEIVGSDVLLAVGRRPNTDDLGLDKAGVRCDERGYIVVDDELRTNVAGVWALGDCNGKGAFTHTAYNDFEIVAANLLDGDSRRVSDRIPAYALYTDPPLGRVGMTLAEARRSGRRVLAGERPMTRVARAIEKGETQGFMRILVDGDTKQILGASLLGTGCDEAVHAILDLIYAKAPYTVMQRAVHIHPTVSELLPTILGSLQPIA